MFSVVCDSLTEISVRRYIRMGKMFGRRRKVRVQPLGYPPATLRRVLLVALIVAYYGHIFRKQASQSHNWAPTEAQI